MHTQLSSFFKGMSFPFYSVPVVNAIVFGSYEFYKRILNSQAVSNNEDSHEAYMQGLYSGFFAGFVNAWVVSPVELVKCRLQVQLDNKENLSSANRYTGPMDVVKKIAKKDGFKGFFRGNVATMLRELPCYGAQFAAYEATKDFFKAKYGEYMFWHKLIAGANAGLWCWIASYPQDMIKTKLQCDLGDAEHRRYPAVRGFFDGGVIRCAADIWRTKGLMGFWRGFSACAIRACYANAMGFLAYEFVRESIFTEEELKQPMGPRYISLYIHIRLMKKSQQQTFYHL
eukprot:TRINITY_DN1666_c0_g2_i4.p1 TRINITY_DN1666_c0_g2~~TRINITY_DN1666_c0_g2_i4.p1  ORF type:complete len:285 (-),score=52.79 TRINITY_DN1666_c0_g2_i4:186-1040(-)